MEGDQLGLCASEARTFWHFSVPVAVPSSGVAAGTTYKIRGRGSTTAGTAYVGFKVTG